MHIQHRNQQVNRRHIKLTYLLTALEPARGWQLGILYKNLAGVRRSRSRSPGTKKTKNCWVIPTDNA